MKRSLLLMNAAYLRLDTYLLLDTCELHSCRYTWTTLMNVVYTLLVFLFGGISSTGAVGPRPAGSLALRFDSELLPPMTTTSHRSASRPGYNLHLGKKCSAKARHISTYPQRAYN